MGDKIKNAYRSSKKIYDSIMTQKNLLSKIYIKFFWKGTDDLEIAKKILSLIPDNFSGTVLDIPVGTAIFTQEKWKCLSKSKILCVDYSKDMIEQAESRLKDCAHISFLQGDVRKLPLDNSSYDIVFSMNGLHAFQDKENAFKEILRVIKPNGKFIGCFYIQGEFKKADWLVKNILSKKGWFTPPFYTKNQVKTLLEKMYKEVKINSDGAIIYFECVK